MPEYPKKSEAYVGKRPTPTRNGPMRLVGNRNSPCFDLGTIDALEILHFICGVITRGDLVSFTQTSDGGALCFTILSGDKRIKGYARSEAECYVRMTDLLEVCYG